MGYSETTTNIKRAVTHKKWGHKTACGRSLWMGQVYFADDDWKNVTCKRCLIYKNRRK